MYKIKRQDPWGNWVDILHAHHGHIAYNFYKLLKEREGEGYIKITQQ